MAKRSIISGLIMMWGRGMSEFGAVLVIAYFPMTTPVLIFERFTSFGLKYARPVSTLFVLLCLLFFILFRIINRLQETHRFDVATTDCRYHPRQSIVDVFLLLQ